MGTEAAPFAKIAELDLILFLHSCYFSIELAKTTIDNFYTYRTHSPEMFSNCNPTNSALRLTLDNIFFADLPKRSPEGYRILLCKLVNLNANVYQFNNHAKLFDMCVMQSYHENGPAEGLIVIIDMQAFTVSHLMKVHALQMKKVLMYLQEALPVRLKALCYLHTGSVMDGLMAIMKPFLKPSLTEVFHFFTNPEEMFKLIPKECLPSDYGGGLDSIKTLHGIMIKRYLENKSFFQEEDKYVVDESKRPGKPKNVNDIFGIEGSFKKLDID
ncbi:hypothetical protein FQR65_LT06910 [Abscondita terminalis]|nr:hypothetical protein FQR65_LT06910 [Abscondita terminalis]